jgi:hypothetical protein
MRRFLPVPVAVALLAVPAAAGASCSSKIGKTGHVLEQSRKAVVYSRVDPPRDDPSYYGCEFRTGKLRLIGREEEQRFAHWKLAGHYAAVVHWPEEAAPQELVQSLWVYDLQAGRFRLKRRAVKPPTPVEGDRIESIRSYVLKPHASVAWIAEFRPDPREVPTTFQVNEVEASRDDRFTKLDEGDAIKPRSLALSDDHKNVYWINGETVRSARLR